MGNYTSEDEKKDLIKYHQKVLSGEVKIDLRRSYHFSPKLGRKKTKEEVLDESREYLKKYGVNHG